MTNANIVNLTGAAHGTLEMPSIFSEEVRKDLIMRAVLAENTLKLQPKGHSPLAGYNTTARYYGAMNSYRTGRRRGIAMRPRQKLAGGIQGAVRKIPSSTKGHRAHPHKIQKTLIENINKREYQKAIISAAAATTNSALVRAKHAAEMQLPIILTNDIESVKRTKEVSKILDALKLSKDLEKSKNPEIRKGLRRLSERKKYRKSVLIVVNEDKGIVKAARNIAGVDACTLKDIKAGLLAPGGVPGRVTVWSENAVKNFQNEVQKLSLM